MYTTQEIGGYFGLELHPPLNNINNRIALNCGRNCLRYIIRAYGIKEIFVPYYTCSAVWQAIRKENCAIKLYHIDGQFMPTRSFNPDDFILYTNYFGVCAKHVCILARMYRNLIVDNTQAFYMPPRGLASFNSLRKFFGVPDGALLSCPQKLSTPLPPDTSYQKCAHLLKRLDAPMALGYTDFCKNEDNLQNAPLKTMSVLTTALFNYIDTARAKEQRLNNFQFLHKELGETNALKITLTQYDVPMVYPYLIKNDTLRKKLLNNNIYTETYWSPRAKDSQESIFQKYLLPLPIDQRYLEKDMQRILSVIKHETQRKQNN